MWNSNGILIQEIENLGHVKNFIYEGINNYDLYPLTHVNDAECRALSSEQLSKEISEGKWISLEFITNVSLYARYLRKCRDLGLKVRVLFIESEYTDELWEGEMPKLNLLGYECTPIPFDNQIITDIDWFPPLSDYWTKLNRYGLFDTYEGALEFWTFYKKFYDAQEIGDGQMNVYICRVSEVVFERL